MMKKILITGATGNIGFELIRFLYKAETEHTIVAGVRDIPKAKKKFSAYPYLNYVQFDFDKPESFEPALNGVDSVFLLRPPHISNVNKYFAPLIDLMSKNTISQVLFLSVQGADKSKIIPHNKIERLIQSSGISYIFLRPSYFMQNLTDNILPDIQQKRKIRLPAGKAKFNWVDIENIGEAAAVLLRDFSGYKNKALEITGYQNENFEYVAKLISTAISEKVEYESLNPFRFFFVKKKEGMPAGKIVVMIMLHFLPRFQPEPVISNFYEKLTGKKPTSLQTFVEREKERFV
jgi:uncharacterized protein YbjT (DUF2867 family)